MKRRITLENATEQFKKIRTYITEMIDSNRYTEHHIFYLLYRELLDAINNNNFYLVRLLLKYNADPNFIKVPLNNVPLIQAAHQNNTDIVELLLEFGADPEVVDSNGDTYRDILKTLSVAGEFINNEVLNDLVSNFQGLGKRSR